MHFSDSYSCGLVKILRTKAYWNNLIDGMIANLEQNGYKISYTALRREAETYVEEHFKMKPKAKKANWDKFKRRLKKDTIPKEMLQ